MQKLDGGVAEVSAAGFNDEELEELWSVVEIEVRSLSKSWSLRLNTHPIPSGQCGDVGRLRMRRGARRLRPRLKIQIEDEGKMSRMSSISGFLLL